MDREVFSKPEVADFFSKKFIAVKVQMDKTASDNESVKQWYNDVKKIKNSYSVTAFPTYLFFDADGKVVHKAVGFKAADQFIPEAEKSLDPEKQYYTILSRI